MTRTLDCPLTDKTVEMTETLSCSTMGTRMNLQLVTSCDFVTRLPDCTRTAIPIYRDFSEDDAIRLEGLVATDGFGDISGMSRFYRAWYIESQLDLDSGGGNPVVFLLDGLLHEDGLIADDTYRNAVETALDEHEPDIGGIDASLPSYGRAVFAAALGYGGDADGARGQLALMQDSITRDRPLAKAAMDDIEADGGSTFRLQSLLGTLDYLEMWSGAFETCLDDLGQDGCRAGDTLRPDGDAR